MTDRIIDEGIERYIRYVRRMSALPDEQLRILLGIAMERNPDSYMAIGIDIEGHINHIRNMAMLTDEQLRASLKKSAKTDPIMEEVFEDASKKKAILDMSKTARDIKGDPRKFARRVDKF